MEKITQQMEDDQMCPRIATPPDPPKPYTQAGDQRKKTAHQHLQPTRLLYAKCCAVPPDLIKQVM